MTTDDRVSGSCAWKDRRCRIMKPLHGGGHQESEHEPTPSSFDAWEMSILPIGGEKGNRGFVPSLCHESRKLSRHFSEREIMRSISVNLDTNVYWITFFFFVVPLDRWRFEYKGLGGFRLFENRISKVLDAFKRNIVIFFRDWLRRIIFLFFFVPGKRQLDTFYRRDENRFMVSRWKFSSSYIYFVTLGI